MPTICFRKYLKNGGAQQNQISGTCTQIKKYTMCANFDFSGQKVRPPCQVKVKCALRDRLQT